MNYRLQFDYTMLNEVMRIIKKHECIVVKQELQLFCLMEVGIPKASAETCVPLLTELKSMELSAI